MVGQQRSARRRHEGSQASQQLQWIDEQRRGAVTPGPAKLIQELPTRALRESLQGQGRAQKVAGTPASPGLAEPAVGDAIVRAGRC